MSRYVAFVVRHRWLVVLLSLLLSAALGVGLGRLSFQNDFTIFFADDDPRVAAYNRVQDTYTKRENVLIGLFPRSGDATDERTLAAVAELTDAAWRFPYARRVDSLTNYQYVRADGEDVVVGDLVPSGAHTDPAIRSRARTVALNEPLLRGRLLSLDGSATAVNINAQLPGLDKRSEVPEIVLAAEAGVEALRDRYPDIEFAITGVLPMEMAISRATRADIAGLMPVAGGLALLALLLAFRNLYMAVAVMLVALLSVISAMGATGWTGFSLDPTTATAPTMILTLAIADSVHVLVSFRSALATGAERAVAITEAIKTNLHPVTLTTLTTVAGFLSLNASTSPPFAHLGTITAVGLSFAYLYTMLFLPALMSLMPGRLVVDSKSAGADISRRIADQVIRYPRRLLLLVGLVCAVLIAQIPNNEVSDNFVTLFDPQTDFRRDTDRVTERITGLYFLDYSLAAEDGGEVTSPAFLAEMQRFENWLSEQPEVLHVASINPVLKRLNSVMHGGAAEAYRLPESAAATAQYLLLYEMSLPYGLDLTDRLSVDRRATRLTASLRSVSTREILDFKARSEAWLAGSALRTDAEGISPSVMFSFISRHNVESMTLGTLVAFVLISATLVFSLRSLKIGIISLVPNLVPAAVAFGIWALLVGKVGLAVSVVAAMTMGIVVDDTIHFLARYLRGRREHGLTPEAAVRYTFESTGPAIWFTTTVLVIAFGTLATSSFQINMQMGLLAAITFAVALIADFLLLPPVLLLTDRDDKDRSGA